MVEINKFGKLNYTIEGAGYTVNSEKMLRLSKRFVIRPLQMMAVKETVNALNRICLAGE